MGDAAGQAADRLEGLGLVEAALEPGPLGDVDVDAEDALDRIAVADRRDHRVEHPALAAVDVLAALAHDLAGQGARVRGPPQGEDLGRQVGVLGPLADAVAPVVDRGRVLQLVATVGAHHPAVERQAAEDGLEPGLAPAAGLLGIALRGQVDHQRDRAEVGAVLGVGRRRAHPGPQRPAVGAAELEQVLVGEAGAAAGEVGVGLVGPLAGGEVEHRALVELVEGEREHRGHRLVGVDGARLGIDHPQALVQRRLDEAEVDPGGWGREPDHAAALYQRSGARAAGGGRAEKARVVVSPRGVRGAHARRESIVKLTKFVILAGAVIALVSFFLPLVSANLKEIDLHAKFSAFQLVKGASTLEDAIGGKAATAHQAEAKQAIHDLQGTFDTIKGVVALAYSPAALLFLVGLIGVVRGKLGRLGGFFALLFGAVAGGVGAVMLAATGGSSDAASAKPGLAIYAMLLGGALGTLGGLVALVKPDRGANW